MSLYRIKMNGKTYEMEVELIEEGKPIKGKKPDKAKNTKESEKNAAPEVTPKASPNTITAPMPGNIIEIVAKQGESVSEGDVVLVLEAMKMENEVCAPRTGKIKKYYVTEGQAVGNNAPLFDMED